MIALLLAQESLVQKGPAHQKKKQQVVGDVAVATPDVTFAQTANVISNVIYSGRENE